MTDLELFDEAVEHHVAPALPSFFEDFWREAEQRQRASARRWRRTALVLVVLAAAASAAAGVLAASHDVAARIVDQTWSCPVALQGAGTRVQVHASVRTPRDDAYLHLTPQPLPMPAAFGLAALHIDTDPAELIWNDANRCTRSHVRLPLGPSGLPSNGVVTTHFVGAFNAYCPTAPRILFRARIAVGSDVTRAQVVVVNEATRKPIAYVDWSQSRIASWLERRCTSYAS